MSLVGKALVRLLRGYKAFISPWLPASCRFYPSCSEYACESIELHGVARGSGLAVRRLLRCQPWCRGGFDPVPEPGTGKSQGICAG